MLFPKSSAFARVFALFPRTLCSLPSSSDEGSKTPGPDVKVKTVKRFPGDTGRSLLLSGVLLPKSHIIFQALGDAEELNDYIGLARWMTKDSKHPYDDHLKRIQTVVIDVQILISKGTTKTCPDLIAHRKELEEWIDMFSNELQPNEKFQFIVPGGSSAICYLQITRSVCKRAERSAIAIAAEHLVTRDVPIYLNRLAKFLFVLSRVSCKLDQRTELYYIPKPKNHPVNVKEKDTK